MSTSDIENLENKSSTISDMSDQLAHTHSSGTQLHALSEWMSQSDWEELKSESTKDSGDETPTLLTLLSDSSKMHDWEDTTLIANSQSSELRDTLANCDQNEQ